MEIGKIIAINVKRLREERHWSQGQLAERAGLSKVIVSQIEKGDANPTINTVWKLTGAFGLPYTSLLELPEAQAVHVRRGDTTELVDDQYHIFCYYPKDRERNFELYEIEMEPGCCHESIGHSPSGFEYVVLVEGAVTIIVGETEYRLEKDDALYFDASGSHTYVTRGDGAAKLVMVIQYL